jgi:uncharacterized HAD superfamily protein
MKKSNDSLFWVVQFLFGIVFGQGLVLYRDLLIDPFLEGNFIPLFALLTIYLTTLFSWKDFSSTMEKSPYGGKILFGDIRFYFDVLIVIIYAVTIFSVQKMIPSKIESKETDLSFFLFDYVIIFFLYLLSGVVRIIEYGRLASRWKLITIYLLLYTLLWFSAGWLYSKELFSKETMEIIQIGAVLFLTITYRVTRKIVIRVEKNNKKKGLRIAIDVDGVLANQIDYLLPLIETKYGLKLKYCDIVKWDMEIADTNIKDIIENRQINDDEYIMTMKVIDKAKSYIDILSRKNLIIILTARDTSLDQSTKSWLKGNNIKFDHYINKKSKSKDYYSYDVLIDDYHGNFKNFTDSDNKLLILYDQPWNREFQVPTYIKRAKCWKEVFDLVKDYKPIKK